MDRLSLHAWHVMGSESALRSREEEQPELKSFSPKDGIELNLYFYEGEWTGQAAVRPVNIGAMKVVPFIEGDKTPSVAALQHDIGEIVSEEIATFKSQR